ncbi:MAG: response regulator [Nitrospiraceae bacterium]|nr:response regulator [Nitrospiraceae bacterium]
MKTVLVIEDNEDNLRLITYALERGGYDVTSAKTGEEGFELTRKIKPYFIIMDINLPGIDGIETTKKIRQSDFDGSIPIIAITSYAMTGDREKVMEAGCNGYLEKPIDPLTIIDKIHEIIKGSSSK